MVSYVIPPDTRAVGTGDPANDMDAVADMLGLYGAVLAGLGGLPGNADPAGNSTNVATVQALKAGSAIMPGLAPSGDTSGTTDAFSIQACLNAAGGCLLQPGQFYTNSTVTVPFNGFLAGFGMQSVINFKGSGACVRMYNPTSPAGYLNATSYPCGFIRDLVIDGSGSSGSVDSYGLHIGDGYGFRVDNVWIRLFANTAGSIGWWEDNTVFWTEKMIATRINLWMNSLGFKADVNGGSGPSHEFNYYDFNFKCLANQSAMWVTKGAYISNSHIYARGNFIAGASGGSNSGWFLKLGDGTNSTGSKMNLNHFHVAVEADQNSGGDTHLHQTLVLDSDTQISQSYGIMSFNPTGGNSWVAANFNAATATRFAFGGVIQGDGNLCAGSAPTAGGQPSMMLAGSPLLYAPGSLSGGTMKTGHGDFFSQTLTANTTIDLTGGDSAGCVPGPQRKTITLKQDGTGSRTVTWPHAGSPTVTSPTVLWAGGSAPTQTAAAGSTDVYELSTFDGITWYGTRIAANVS